MAISINWSTKVITVPQSYLSLVSGTLYELDADQFRLDLKDLEDSEEGMIFPQTHNHSTQVILSGVTYARIVEIINGYTITFENTGTPYTVRVAGANHNFADVTNYDGGMSLIISNSAGLIVTETGAGGLNLNDIIEGSITLRDVLRLLSAVHFGKTEIIDLGGGLATVRFRDQADTKNRIEADMDGSERTSITLDPS